MDATDTAILIFAKAPHPGAVKTRLIPALGAEGAAMLHTALVERVITCAASTMFDVVLCCAPNADDSFFDACAEDFEIELTNQLTVDNLGVRMLHSFEEALAEWPQVLLVGADCPAFTKKHLLDAAAQLRTHDCVLTPAEDGGYVLIGAKRTTPTMFDHIDWGTDQVMAQQRTALAKAGLSWHETATLWDVDLPDDLPRLQTLKPPLEFFWPT